MYVENKDYLINNNFKSVNEIKNNKIGGKVLLKHSIKKSKDKI